MSAFKSKSRFFRLLPGVMLVCLALLVLNTSGLVHDALAQEGAPAPADATAPAPTGANPDFADAGNGQMASAAEVDVLTSLSKRNAALDARDAQIKIEASILTATESRVDGKIAQLKALQAQIAALVAQRDAGQEKQVQALVKTYSAMKPKDAAGIFNSLDDSVLLPVAQEMKSDTLAPVLAAMNPEAARKLTVKLASKLTLPDTASVMTPLAAPAAAAPGASQAANPPAAAAAPAASAGAAAPKPNG